MEKKRHLEIRSEEVQDILGRMPAWITRNGTTLVFVVVVLLFVGSWFFKYPDIITSPIVVTTENPPANIVARVDGKITQLYVKDKEHVEKGQRIALLENPANFDDVLDLEKHLRWLSPFFIDFDLKKQTVFKDSYTLGTIQPKYTAFLKLYNDYLHFSERNYYPEKINALQDQVGVYRMYYDRQWSRRKVVAEDLGLAEQKFKRDSLLYNKGVLSLAEYQTSKQTLLNKQYDFEGVRTTLAETQMKILDLQQSVIDMQNKYDQEKKGLQLSLEEAYNNLRGEIGVWELNYLMKAPIDGNATFTKFWSVNQNVTKGENVFTIVPDKPSRIIGKVKLQIQGSGKVKVGQKVNIKFANYPYMEYGMVEGRVDKISEVPNDNYYSCEVNLPNGLVTNYGTKLDFNHEISGTAEIITEDRRLIQRLFDPIKSIFRERVAR
ncbi:hemolysin [Prolixibacter sp. NT017]|nr:hemolysin [Prolixibacter sp. NT017]